MPTGRWMRSLGFAAAALLSATFAAAAHPHVWVVSKSEVVFAPDGAIVAVRHAWTFDEMFSAYATQGLETGADGRISSEALEELAEVNVTSLKEFGYFSAGKVGEAAVEFVDPVEYRLEADSENVLTLHFTLPVKTKPAKGVFILEVYDPTWFVDFSYADEGPVALANAPAGCRTDVHRPQTNTATTTLSESFFNSLTAASSFGSQFANRISVKCQ
jgi:ABC-type uncharacterized transport system substrate-binding protein